MNAAQSYEEEQQRLQQEVDGDAVHITVPKEPEVNPEVWRDVEPLLYRGFLTQEADINGVYFVFKSMNHHEFESLRFRGGFRAGRASEGFWDIFLSHAVFMVDGINLLTDRETHLEALSTHFRSVSKTSKAKIIRHISEVNRRASVATTLTEAYAMEAISRYRWLQLQGLDLTSVAVTGIYGTDRLGLNWAQQIWRALNLIEDRNDTQEREWENAKFIGSCFAGKGLQKVYAQDTERRRKEKEERITRKDKLLRELLLGEKIEEGTTVIPGAVIKAPKTVDELATQLEKDLRGEQDWHDQVIREHEDRIRQRYQERLDQQKRVAEETDKHFGPKSVVGDETDLKGLSEAEVRDRILHSKQRAAQAAARRQIHVPDEKTQNFLDRWELSGESDEVSTTKRDISEAHIVPPRRPTGKPFGR